jgi:hypothetical protein
MKPCLLLDITFDLLMSTDTVLADGLSKVGVEVVLRDEYDPETGRDELGVVDRLLLFDNGVGKLLAKDKRSGTPNSSELVEDKLPVLPVSACL